MSAYANVEDAKQQLEQEIDRNIAERGVFTASTCPTGQYHGWDMNLHYALEWFMRNCPPRWHIGRILKWECYDWTITAR